MPLHPWRALHHVVALQRGDRDVRHLRVPRVTAAAQLARKLLELLHQLLVALAREVNQVHLVDRHHHLRDAQQRADESVALGLLQHALARVDQHHRHVGSRGARHHVARVLLVAGAVGDDEAPPRGGEVAVGHVDRDPLLALRAQAVGEQREVERARPAAPGAGLRDVLQLVLEHLLGVVQEAPDQRALAVVDRAGGGEAQQVEGHRRGPIASARAPPLLPPLVGGSIKSLCLRIRNTRPSCGPPSRPPTRGRRRASRPAR